MKKIVSSRGKVWVDEFPDPICNNKEILVQNIASVISSGTEKDSIKVRKGALQILKDRPDLKRKAKLLLSKEGLIKGYKIGMEIIKEPIPLGYSCSGVVLEIGKDISHIKVGDRVACMGYGANHAEFIIVTENLCNKLPEQVSFKEGAFGTLGAIAMQGVRRANISIGENIAVIGLGLIGNLTIQILKAAGCTVVGFDINNKKVEFSKKYCDNTYNIKNADIDIIKNKYTNGYGFDNTIITAVSKTNEPVVSALELIRKKGKIVMIGRSPIDIPRESFYEKEADFLISTSYGPGRYDPDYEEKGKYMPLEYVRWNEKENLASFLKLIAEKKINVETLISKEFNIEDAHKAYNLLNIDINIVGVLINYAGKTYTKNVIIDLSSTHKDKVNKERINVGLIGVGSFAKTVHLPNLSKINQFNITALCSKTGLKVKQIGEKYNVDYVTTDYQKIIDDKNIDLIIITTPHNTHAEIVIESLKKNKHTFVEKPLAIKEEDIEEVIKIAKKSKGLLFVGFNRRYALFTEKVKRKINNIPGPRIIHYYVKTNTLPLDSWRLDPDIGGGRIIGELVHFIDYINYLINNEVIDITAHSIDKNSNKLKTIDDVNVSLKYRDGSIGNIIYSPIGSEKYPKETIQIHTGSKSFVIDDFKKLLSYTKKVKKQTLRRQDKGQFNELIQVQKSLLAGEELFNLNQIYLTHKLAFRIKDKIM
jgi:predicted dehydrogenase/threonine dehydrogenase-like Zn-dependent dehydrogenase